MAEELVSLEELNDRVQAWVSRIGGSLPQDMLKDLSDLDQWVKAEVDLDPHVVIVANKWYDDLRISVYGPFETQEDLVGIARRLATDNPDLRFVGANMMDPGSIEVKVVND